MKERTKEILRDGFGSLINNAAALRGAKNGPLWLTIVMFFLSIILPIVPIFVSQININGSTFLDTYSFGLEKYVATMATDLKEDNYKFILSEDHLLSIKKDGAEIDYAAYGSNKPFAAYINNGTGEDSSKGQYDFVIYVSDASTSKEKKAVNNAIAAKKYTCKTIEESIQTENVYTPSYMIIFRNGLYVAMYGYNSTTVKASSYNGDFKTMKATDDGLAYLLTVKDKDGNTINQDLLNKDYTAGVYKNFKVVLNKSYETLKIANVWGTCGIYAGVFTGLILLLGFLMWVLTRGKKNPNNYFSVWLTMKVAARLAPAPAILTLIIGFFLTSQVPIIFIMLMGLRTMWISMKELRPVVQ